MPIVTIKNDDSFKPVRFVEHGDLVLIDNAAYIASGSKELKLICLSDGLEWYYEKILEGATEEELRTYVNGEDQEGLYVTELIKGNDYKINIEMK